MRAIAIIEADLAKTPLGTRSRLAERLAGEAVLRRTARRVKRAERVANVHVVVPSAQRAATSDLLQGLDAVIDTCDDPPPAWRAMVRAARKWSLGGWRGGPLGTCWFDECMHVPMLAALAARETADAVTIVPAAACLVDPRLLDDSLEHFEDLDDPQPFGFTQAPPGLATVVVRAAFLDNLTRANHWLGRLFTYRPDNPVTDVITKACCYRLPDRVITRGARLIADNARSVALMARCLERLGEDAGAERICGDIRANESTRVDAVPREIEIELTTREQLAGSPMRPRGTTVGREGDMDLSLLEQLVGDLAGLDDVNLVIGGFGEPLLHPSFGRATEIIRDSAALGIAIRTNALALDDAACKAIIDARVDVVSPLLDAAGPDAYRRLHGYDGFGAAMAGIDRLASTRGGSGVPLIIPELVKVRDNVDQMEAFYDDWLRRTGWACIAGFNHGAGQRESLAVRSMAPPTRTPCRRLWDRTLVLADGSVIACDQDYQRRQPLGRLGDVTLPEVWTCDAFAALRESHLNATYSHPLCPTCDDWHRP